MKLSIKQIIYILIFAIIFFWILGLGIKNNRLKNQINREKIEKIELQDSIKFINQQHLDAIKIYEDEVKTLNDRVDSLDRIKQRIIVKKDEVIVSNDASEAAKLLKYNLHEKNFD